MALTEIALLAAALASFLSIPVQARPAESKPAKVEKKEAAAEKDRTVTVTIPNQPITIQIEADGFRKEDGTQFGSKSLVFASIAKDGTLNVLYEPNFPHQSSINLREQWAKRPNYLTFSIGNIAACEFTNESKGSFVQSFYHAHPVTPDFAFDITVTVARIKLKGAAPEPKFTRDDFIKIVKSFTVTGDPNRDSFRLPAEVYEVRDKAMKMEHDQLNWVSKQCSAAPDDFALHYYFGALAQRRKNYSLASDGFLHAAGLLSKKENRNAKDENALVDALAGGSASLIAQKRFRDAAGTYQKLLDTTKPDGPPEVKKMREEAVYLLACCHAQIAQPEKALEILRNAVAATPSLKARAKDDPLLAPLKATKDFAKIVEES
ncbi:MAG: tetratricopeptide repeat protein [Planctomycetota bacterium]